METFHEGHLYPCPLCEKKYRRKEDVHRHSREVHSTALIWRTGVPTGMSYCQHVMVLDDSGVIIAGQNPRYLRFPGSYIERRTIGTETPPRWPSKKKQSASSAAAAEADPAEISTTTCKDANAAVSKKPSENINEKIVPKIKPPVDVNNKKFKQSKQQKKLKTEKAAYNAVRNEANPPSAKPKNPVEQSPKAGPSSETDKLESYSTASGSLDPTIRVRTNPKKPTVRKIVDKVQHDGLTELLKPRFQIRAKSPLKTAGEIRKDIIASESKKSDDKPLSPTLTNDLSLSSSSSSTSFCSTCSSSNNDSCEEGQVISSSEDEYDPKTNFAVKRKYHP